MTGTKKGSDKAMILNCLSLIRTYFAITKEQNTTDSTKMPSSDTMEMPLDPNIQVAFDGKTKLCEVIEAGNLEMLNHFLQYGLDPDQKLYKDADEDTHHIKVLKFTRPPFIPFDKPEYERPGYWDQRYELRKFLGSVSAQKYAESLAEAAEKAVVFLERKPAEKAIAQSLADSWSDMAAKLREAKEIKSRLQSEKGTEVDADQEHYMDIASPAAMAGGSSEVLTEQHAHALKVQSTDIPTDTDDPRTNPTSGSWTDLVSQKPPTPPRQR